MRSNSELIQGVISDIESGRQFQDLGYVLKLRYANQLIDRKEYERLVELFENSKHGNLLQVTVPKCLGDRVVITNSLKSLLSF